MNVPPDPSAEARVWLAQAAEDLTVARLGREHSLLEGKNVTSWA